MKQSLSKSKSVVAGEKKLTSRAPDSITNMHAYCILKTGRLNDDNSLGSSIELVMIKNDPFEVKI